MQGRNRARFLGALVVGLGFVTSFTGVAWAETIPLSELLAGGTISSGTHVFSDFDYAITGTMPTADAVNVISIQDQDGNFGIRFQGGFFDLPGDSASDALITYKVTSTAPGVLISGAAMAANPTVVGNGIVSITETFLPTFSAPNDMMDVTSGVNLVDSIVFSSPVESVMVQKDILIFAEGTVSTLSFVDQTFPQTPEPSSSVLSLIGMTVLVLLRRRRR